MWSGVRTVCLTLTPGPSCPPTTQRKLKNAAAAQPESIFAGAVTRNNSPRLVAHRFTVGDVPLCGRSTLNDPDTIYIDVDDGRLTTKITTSTEKTSEKDDITTSTREQGTARCRFDADRPFRHAYITHASRMSMCGALSCLACKKESQPVVVATGQSERVEEVTTVYATEIESAPSSSARRGRGGARRKVASAAYRIFAPVDISPIVGRFAVDREINPAVSVPLPVRLSHRRRTRGSRVDPYRRVDAVISRRSVRSAAAIDKRDRYRNCRSRVREWYIHRIGYVSRYARARALEKLLLCDYRSRVIIENGRDRINREDRTRDAEKKRRRKKKRRWRRKKKKDFKIEGDNHRDGRGHDDERSTVARSSSVAAAESLRLHPHQVHQRGTAVTHGQPAASTHVSSLYPEILALIFSYLDVRDKGRAAQVCTAWRDAAYYRSVWRGVEARLHLRKQAPALFASLVRRGVKKVQVLSLRRGLSDVLKGVPNLEALNLSGCYNITDSGITNAFCQEYPSLIELNLSLCKQVTDTSLSRIAQFLKNLEHLELGGCCNITNTGLLLIAWGLKKLKRLDLRSCWHVSDLGIAHLAGLNRETADGNLALEHLSLQDCQRLSDEALRHVSLGLTTLKSINLSFCVCITDSGVKHLARMSSLRELNLRSCDNISDIGMAYLAEGGSRITSLDVSFCDKIGDQALVHISQGLFNLKSLSLSACQISDEGICKIAKTLHDLETLNIGQCSRLTDRGLHTVAESMKNLKCIDLYGCTKITTSGLERIMKLPQLSTLNLGLWHVR
ncbi:F-box/LRR-repeat protein 14 [Trachymyrmex septentrionalis]|uniref:F-box/LRR-repeat protein 14 n=1 Tax=Trachymyrmex septentrionalis TaxID=34720 RepID=A0A195FI20_9HYME|nr:F-box/LRR-repeat protein 14 [Trachymyrmex septentrionalis]